MERTVRDFIEDKITDNRTYREIMAIVNACHWKTSIEDIKKELARFSINSK